MKTENCYKWGADLDQLIESNIWNKIYELKIYISPHQSVGQDRQLCYLNTKVALPCTCVLVAMLRNRKKWQLRFLLCVNKVWLLAGSLLKHRAFWNSASATLGIASIARVCEGEEVGGFVVFVSVLRFFGLGFFFLWVVFFLLSSESCSGNLISCW